MPPPNNRSVINTFAPSPVAAGEIWAGTNNGIIELTKDSGVNGKRYLSAGPLALRPDQHGGGVALRRRHRLHCRGPPRRKRFPARTSTARATPARPGRRPRRVSPTAVSRAWCAKIRSAGACSTPERRTAAYVSFDDGDHWSSLATEYARHLGARPGSAWRRHPVVCDLRRRLLDSLDDLTPLRQIDRAVATPPRCFSPGLKKSCGCGWI